MRGVRRAAAVAADEQLVAGSQAGQNHFCRAIQGFFQSRQSAKRRDGIVNRLLQVCHARRLAESIRRENHEMRLCKTGVAASRQSAAFLQSNKTGGALPSRRYDLNVGR